MARAKQPVSVDDIEFDALIDSEEGYEADVPEYPTEKGFSVSDTIVLKADTLNMTLYVTDTPVTWRERTGSGPGKTEGVVRRLKDLYFAKKILEVTTTDCVYERGPDYCHLLYGWMPGAGQSGGAVDGGAHPSRRICGADCWASAGSAAHARQTGRHPAWA